LGALRGLAPVEGGAEKLKALERWGRLPPSYYDIIWV